MVTLEDVLSIAEQIAVALFDKLKDDGKLTVLDAIQLVILLTRLISQAVRK